MEVRNENKQESLYLFNIVGFDVVFRASNRLGR